MPPTKFFVAQVLRKVVSQGVMALSRLASLTANDHIQTAHFDQLTIPHARHLNLRGMGKL
jgi:hypothetical protein